METKVWSEQQDKIFDWFANGKGNLVCRARAGTGKTTTIIEAVGRAPEHKKLLCAFNRKIAIELQNRIKGGGDAKTLHSIGYGFVIQAWGKLQMDDDRPWKLALKACGEGAPYEVVTLVNKLASRCKNTLPFSKDVFDFIDEAEEIDAIPDENMEELGWTKQIVAEKAMLAMDLACQKDGTIHYDDMVFVAVRNNLVRPRYDLVVVDEAQDMSPAQLTLAQRVCKKGGRIAVVGDDRQAIYGFRGADSNSINRLKTELRAVELGLTTTYRCPKSVVELAAAIVPDFKAAPTAPEGVVGQTTRKGLVDLAKANDFVLSRKNAPLVSVCMAFLRAGKRARIEGRDIGKTLVSLVNKLNAKSMPQFIEKLGKWRDKELKRADKLAENRRDAKKEGILDTYETLLTLSEGMKGVSELKTHITSLFDNVAEKNDTSFIICSSTHKAKGLERDNVFLLEETFSERHHEEANIKYVAISRARQRLVWVQLDE